MGLTPATHRYKVIAYAVNYHEVTSLTGRDTRRRHVEDMCAVMPVFRYLNFSTTSIRNSIETNSKGQYKCIL